jgi:signal transduction histidine kinase
VRLAELRRTTSFRLALLFLMLFGATSLGLVSYLYWQTRDYIVSRVDDWLAREQAGFVPMDRDSILKRLAAHVVSDPTLERPFTLFDRDGTRKAGSPLNLTPSVLAGAPRDAPFRFVLQQGRETLIFRGQLHRMPSGELLLIARDMDEPHQFGQVLIHAFIWGGLASALIGLAGAAITGADSVRRIDAVTRAIQRIVAGNFSERLPTRGRSGDLDRLVVEINGMLNELEHLMREVKGVGDSIAHDLRTPLTRLLAGLERTRRRAVSAGDYAAAVDEAIVETQNVLATFAALLRISEVESGARRAGFKPVDLREVVADAVEFYEPVAEEKRVSLHLVCDNDAVAMRGDPSLLFEVTGNLVDNAIKYTPAGGTVTVRSFAQAGTVGIEVTDSGPGIPPAEREAVLRRFYRAEASRHTPGSGLGLALAAAVARLHEMDLEISDANPGARIAILHRATAHNGGDAMATAATKRVKAGSGQAARPVAA